VNAKDLLHGNVAAWNGRNRAAYVGTYVEDCSLTSPDGSGKGHEPVGGFYDSSLGMFPDNRVRVVALAEDGELPAEEGVLSGTNTGPIPMPDGTEVPATGAAVELPYLAMHTVRDDRIVESRYYWDQMAMLGQLGLLPPT
jgi:predicted ester cyclase